MIIETSCLFNSKGRHLFDTRPDVDLLERAGVAGHCPVGLGLYLAGRDESINSLGLPHRREQGARVRTALGDGIEYPPPKTCHGPLYLTVPLAWNVE